MGPLEFHYLDLARLVRMLIPEQVVNIKDLCFCFVDWF